MIYVVLLFFVFYRLCKSPNIQRVMLKLLCGLPRSSSHLLHFFLTTVFLKGPREPEFCNPVKTQGFQIAALENSSWNFRTKKYFFNSTDLSSSYKHTIYYINFILAKADAFLVHFSNFQCNILQSETEMTPGGRCSGFPPGIKCDCCCFCLKLKHTTCGDLEIIILIALW